MHIVCSSAYSSEWGYNRTNGSCVLDPIYGPKLDCLTGYVCICI